MSEMDYWQAEQFRDECERMKQALAALDAAAKAGTPATALEVLAYECGVGNEFQRRNDEQK